MDKALMKKDLTMIKKLNTQDIVKPSKFDAQKPICKSQCDRIELLDI